METIREAICYANAFLVCRRFKDAKALALKTLPVTRRVLGNAHEYTLRMRSNYAEALYKADDATLDDLREAATTLGEVERIARRVLGSAHPLTVEIEDDLRVARAALTARETQSSSASA